ncbi:MAG TPA: protein kinase, partial [Ktedonobacteraceae bacterium]
MVNHLDYINQQIGDYHILHWLGGGSFGNVYLAEQIRDHAQVAVKLLDIRLTQSEDLKAFINEARTIRLKHPHIVPLLDFGISAENIPFLVMEYAAQGTLRDQHPKGAQVPLETVKQYVQQIASALYYAHEQRLVHRDVKPENMLLRADGAVLLSDFGIASVAHSSQSMSLNQGISGTVSYMAPEQIQGQTRPASDQYSFGIVIYEWLAGRRPFEGTTTEIAIQHLMNTPPSLRTFVPTLPLEIEQVILQALEKDPRQRFASMQAFATAFAQALPASQPPFSSTTSLHSPQQPASQSSLSSTTSHRPPQQQPASRTASPTPPTQSMSADLATMPLQSTQTTTPSHNAQPAQKHISRRVVLASIGSLAVVGIGAGGIALARRPSSLPIVTHRSIKPTPDPKINPSPDPNAPASSPYVENTPTSSSITLPYIYRGHTSAVRAVAWSPDGKYIASGAGSKNDSSLRAQDQTVQTWNATTGNKIYTYNGHAPDLYGYGITAVAWSADSKRIAAGVNDQTVQVWNAFDGSNAVTYPGYGSIADTVAWTPNGTYIASGYEDGKVKIWAATSGTLVHTFLWIAFNACYALSWSSDSKHLATANYNGTVYIWDAVNGEQQPVTYGQVDAGGATGQLAVCWSPDRKQVAAGGRDALVRIWNVADKSIALTYHGHTAAIKAIKWSPDGTYIASAGEDKSTQVWK